MPLDFPNAPNTNDTFTSNGRTWKWNGTTWDLVPIGHTHATADLVDFTVNSPATGDALVYNGTKWANSAAIPQASVSGLVSGLAGKASLYGTFIGNAANLNDYVTPGVYDQSNNAQASTGSNYPFAHAGVLTVTRASGGYMIYQTYQTYRDSNRLYWRSWYDTWSPWRQVQMASNIIDTTSNYWIGLSDAGATIRSTSGAITVYVQNTLLVGDRIDFIQYGAGQITFAASGVTLNSSGGKLKTTGQYSGATIICVASGVYCLIGDIAA